MQIQKNAHNLYDDDGNDVIELTTTSWISKSTVIQNYYNIEFHYLEYLYFEDKDTYR